ncbi:hypothetical protein ACQPZX_25925 [Actinoplanes sp. CA-142083]|uniref:hypothetical protein n=1 Tax=Actinoplanes sp. CA-142083 TaxID=3239903 RepID=UPI003D930CA5
MAEAERPIIWYANSDDPYYTLRHSGGPIVACFLLPALLVLCAGAANGAPALPLLLCCALVPVAIAVAAWEFLLDRRTVVEMRLAGGELTLIRVGGGAVTYPLGEVRRIEVARTFRDGALAATRMRLHVGDRIERTRSGPANLPDGWADAVTVAEIDVRISEKHHND